MSSPSPGARASATSTSKLKTGRRRRKRSSVSMNNIDPEDFTAWMQQLSVQGKELESMEGGERQGANIVSKQDPTAVKSVARVVPRTLQQLMRGRLLPSIDGGMQPSGHAQDSREPAETSTRLNHPSPEKRMEISPLDHSKSVWGGGAWRSSWPAEPSRGTEQGSKSSTPTPPPPANPTRSVLKSRSTPLKLPPPTIDLDELMQSVDMERQRMEESGKHFDAATTRSAFGRWRSMCSSQSWRRVVRHLAGDFAREWCDQACARAQEFAFRAAYTSFVRWRSQVGDFRAMLQTLARRWRHAAASARNRRTRLGSKSMPTIATRLDTNNSIAAFRTRKQVLDDQRKHMHKYGPLCGGSGMQLVDRLNNVATSTQDFLLQDSELKLHRTSTLYHQTSTPTQAPSQQHSSASSSLAQEPTDETRIVPDLGMWQSNRANLLRSLTFPKKKTINAQDPLQTTDQGAAEPLQQQLLQSHCARGLTQDADSAPGCMPGVISALVPLSRHGNRSSVPSRASPATCQVQPVWNERPQVVAAQPGPTSSTSPAQVARLPKSLHNPWAPNMRPSESAPLQTKPPPGLKSAMNRMAQAYVRSIGKWEHVDTSLPRLPRSRLSHHNSQPPPSPAGEEADPAPLPPAGASSSCSKLNPAGPLGKPEAAGTGQKIAQLEESRTLNARRRTEDSRVPEEGHGNEQAAEAEGEQRYYSSTMRVSRSVDERWVRWRRREKSIFRPGTAPHLITPRSERRVARTQPPPLE